MGGDSGAWVIDNASGGVCAHVLAWSSANNTAYISPMEILLDDMARKLGADIKLPEHPADQCRLVQEKLKNVSAEIRVAEEALVPAAVDDGKTTVLSRQLKLSPETQSAPFNLRNHFELETGADAGQEDSNYQAPASPPLSPSPPLATSPPYHLASLSLIDSVAQQRFPDTDMLRHVNTSYRAQSKKEMLDGGRPMRSGVSAEGRAEGVQARC